MKAELATVIAAQVGEQLRSEFPHRADLCVLGSRVTTNVCRYFGIDARPVVVRVLAYNEAWRAFIAEAGPEADSSHPLWEKAKEDDAWSVLIDEEDHGIKGRYPGHVIVMLPSEGLMIDPSLRQFSRPDHSMVFPDVGVWPLEEDFLRGEPVVYESKLGGYIGYLKRTSYRDFRHAPDWKLKDPIAGGIIRQLKQEGRA